MPCSWPLTDMSEVGRLHADELAFLEGFLPPGDASGRPEHGASPSEADNRHSDLPFVTLTYASSLDSMIALAPGVRTTLSGPETKSMTHYLRYKHDAILVGACTAAVDDPGLNCRYPGVTRLEQPRPVVIDPNGRWVGHDRKAFRLASQEAGKAPWIVTQSPAPSTVTDLLLQIGGEYLNVANDATGNSAPEIPWTTILRALKLKGINSVMIEGGATVINALLAQPHLVNAVIITIAPTFLGKGGVAVSPVSKSYDGHLANSAWLDDTRWRQFGNDVVLCGRLRSGS